MRVQLYDWESQIQDVQEVTEKFATYNDFFRHHASLNGWKLKAVTFDGNMSDPFPDKSARFDFHVAEKKFSCSIIM
jgi:hypothetical protein